MRTSLLTWEFQNLELIVLADESYHSKKAIDVMKQLDKDRYILKFLLLMHWTNEYHDNQEKETDKIHWSRIPHALNLIFEFNLSYCLYI